MGDHHPPKVTAEEPGSPCHLLAQADDLWAWGMVSPCTPSPHVHGGAGRSGATWEASGCFSVPPKGPHSQKRKLSGPAGALGPRVDPSAQVRSPCD